MLLVSLLSYERAVCARVDGRLLERQNCGPSIPKQKIVRHVPSSPPIGLNNK